ncbi:MAG: YqgE/AlgH family protein [Isosphaeraceae bacterium]
MTSLKGHLLVATPQLIAPIFNRSVILMLDHSDSGAAGVILNRPTEATVTTIAEQVFEETSDWDKAISIGGPVPGPLLILHTLQELSDQEILPGVYSTVDAARVRSLIHRKPEPSLTLAHYSGWSAGQLEAEIETGSWASLPARSSLVFWEGAVDLWKVVMKELHGRRLTEMLGIRDFPEDPRMN